MFKTKTPHQLLEKLVAIKDTASNESFDRGVTELVIALEQSGADKKEKKGNTKKLFLLGLAGVGLALVSEAVKAATGPLDSISGIAAPEYIPKEEPKKVETAKPKEAEKPTSLREAPKKVEEKKESVPKKEVPEPSATAKPSSTKPNTEPVPVKPTVEKKAVETPEKVSNKLVGKGKPKPLEKQKESGKMLGSLSAQFESGSKGGGAIGYDSTGGTSYGKYQIASKPNKKTGKSTMDEFLSWLKKKSPETADPLLQAGPPDSGKKGKFAEVWSQLYTVDPKGFEELQHLFIKETHYDVSAFYLGKKGFDINSRSKALQDVLWSTSVQHGGKRAADIFSKAFDVVGGFKAEDSAVIPEIYKIRKTQFGSSTEAVQEGVNARFEKEQKIALADSAREKSEPTMVASNESFVTPEKVTASKSKRSSKQEPENLAMSSPSGSGNRDETLIKTKHGLVALHS